MVAAAVDAAAAVTVMAFPTRYWALEFDGPTNKFTFGPDHNADTVPSAHAILPHSLIVNPHNRHSMNHWQACVKPNVALLAKKTRLRC